MPAQRGAFAPDPVPGTEAGPGPTTPRRSAVRRASRLRGRAHASQAWRRALLARHVQGWTSLGAPPIPSLGGRAATKVEREGEEPGGENAPGMKKTGLFDMVNREWRERRLGMSCSEHIASAATCSCPGRARASACLLARGARSRARAGTQGPHDVLPLGPGSRCARPGHESGVRPRARLLAAHCVGPAQSLHRQAMLRLPGG